MIKITKNIQSTSKITVRIKKIFENVVQFTYNNLLYNNTLKKRLKKSELFYEKNVGI
jgi:hypothetical protein